MPFPKGTSKIPSLNLRIIKKAQAHQNQLTKPQGSLGRLEELAIQLAGITQKVTPSLGKKRVIVCAGDHGVAEENISAYPQEVTAQMVQNFLHNGAAINVLARYLHAELQIVDTGVAAPLPPHPQLTSNKIRPGTRNFKKEPAMTPNECSQALAYGVHLARQAHRDHIGIVVTGEMGIGNTTSASALMSVLLPCAVEDVVGYGTGISSAQWLKKCQIIHHAVNLHHSKLQNPFAILQTLGGFEIAVLTGIILGCAQLRIPIMIDGFISSAAFLVAYRNNPRVKDFCFFAHCSEEPGHAQFFNRLKTKPLLDLKMRLGEGTGGVLALSILEAALHLHNEMATFERAQVSKKLPTRPPSKKPVHS
jgi:nicotinate-nucleotide--dimethylbenzimidazole phosphoribosyltransferase